MNIFDIVSQNKKECGRAENCNKLKFLIFNTIYFLNFKIGVFKL